MSSSSSSSISPNPPRISHRTTNTSNHDNQLQSRQQVEQQQHEYNNHPRPPEENDDENGRRRMRNDNNNNNNTLSWNQIVYSLSSFHAIQTPVSVAMILTALSVVYISTEDSRAATQQALTSTYSVFSIQPSGNNNVALSLGKSLVNSLVIVSVIAAMTFLIVLLYKYHCMKLLWTYMILSSALLLGFLGYQFFHTGLIHYVIPLDIFTFYYSLINFAMVGVLVIFFAQQPRSKRQEENGSNSQESTAPAGSFLISIIGSPSYLVQAYLIATSVLLAWQLSNFEEWTTWTLLVLLALYDLCAVLTPCGPLKLLVGLMQRDDAPVLPGLLYEAPITPTAATTTTTRPSRQQPTNRNTSVTDTNTSTSNSTRHDPYLNPSQSSTHMTSTTDNHVISSSSSSSLPSSSATHSSINHILPTTLSSSATNNQRFPSHDNHQHPTVPSFSARASITIQEGTLSRHTVIHSGSNIDPSSSHPSHRDTSDQNHVVDYYTEHIPLAIARVYVLPMVNVPVELQERVSNEWTYRRNRTRSHNRSSTTNPTTSITTNGESSSNTGREVFSPLELNTLVQVKFSLQGGRILPKVQALSQDDLGFIQRLRRRQQQQPQPKYEYHVLDRHGIVKRILVVDETTGQVFVQLHPDRSNDNDDSSEDEELSSSIKLGLVCLNIALYTLEIDWNSQKYIFTGVFFYDMSFKRVISFSILF